VKVISFFSFCAQTKGVEGKAEKAEDKQSSTGDSATRSTFCLHNAIFDKFVFFLLSKVGFEIVVDGCFRFSISRDIVSQHYYYLGEGRCRSVLTQSAWVSFVPKTAKKEALFRRRHAKEFIKRIFVSVLTVYYVLCEALLDSDIL
jgi:hypothetical protein